jgi:hypothetical protein
MNAIQTALVHYISVISFNISKELEFMGHLP